MKGKANAVSYTCEFCKKTPKPGTPAKKVVLTTRPKNYEYRREVNRFSYYDEDGQKQVEYRDDPGGQGYEIVREVTACPNCEMKHNETSSNYTTR